MSAHKVLVILGSVRDGSQGLKVGQAVLKHLAPISTLEAEIIDPAEVNAPLLKQPYHFMPDKSAAPVWMTDLLAKLNQAAGFVIVCPEYNSTIPPALTNLLDYFPLGSYRHKPVSIVSYSMGNFGGIRAAVALRPFLQELGMIMLPSGVTIPTVQKSGISDDGSMDNERIDQHMTKVANELNWYIEALQAKKSETNGFPN